MDINELAAITANDGFTDYDWAGIFPVDAVPDQMWSNGLYSGTFSVHDQSQVEDVTPARIGRIDLVDVVRGDCAETNMCCLVELVDGTWATCMAWCDTTGWDCQAGVEWKWARTRDDAITQGLDREARRKLGVPLAGEAR